MASFIRRLRRRPSSAGLSPESRAQTAGAGAPPRAPAAALEPVIRRVLMIAHDPTVRQRDGRALHEHLGWNDPGRLAELYCRALALGEPRIVSDAELEAVITQAITNRYGATHGVSDDQRAPNG